MYFYIVHAHFNIHAFAVLTEYKSLLEEILRQSRCACYPFGSGKRDEQGCLKLIDVPDFAVEVQASGRTDDAKGGKGCNKIRTGTEPAILRKK